jgi:heme/copper-type cytochrome/quinol oxidase subunit 2
VSALFWWNFWNVVIVMAIVGAIIGLTVWVRRRNRDRRGADTRGA